MPHKRLVGAAKKIGRAVSRGGKTLEKVALAVASPGKKPKAAWWAAKVGTKGAKALIKKMPKPEPVRRLNIPKLPKPEKVRRLNIPKMPKPEPVRGLNIPKMPKPEKIRKITEADAKSFIKKLQQREKKRGLTSSQKRGVVGAAAGGAGGYYLGGKLKKYRQNRGPGK